jgi:general secretion pathway protein G
LDTEVPLDPWGNQYRYEYPGKYQTDYPDIWSYGPDQMDGTDDDIGNWVTIKE